MSPPLNHFHKNVAKRKLRKEFERLFGTAFDPYFSNLLGFDIIRFDDEVIQSGDKCMRTVVKKKYGKRAVELLEELIS
jgi:hypothetical protein